jgi:hypothetical protein
MVGSVLKVRLLVAGAFLLGAMAAPLMAADFHGHGGSVFPHGFHGGGFGRHVAGGYDFNRRGGMPRPGPDRSRFQHRGFDDAGNDRGLTAPNGMWRRNRDDRFGQQDFGNRVHGNHPHVLASGDFSTRRGSGVSVINRSQPDYDVISNYAGSVDVYHANGGTYISGYSDGGDGGQSNTTIRPRSKVIDVARMRNACAYENGVCVIRP